jgi:hypothetical protein
MENPLDTLAQRIGGTKPVGTPEQDDETVPSRLRFLFYGAMLVMAWRTADFLWLTMPQNIFSYPLMAFTLLCLEGGSLVWHHVRTNRARDYVMEDGKKKDSIQFTISGVGFGIDFAFSIVTTLADISHVTGLQEWNLPALQPPALLASGLIVIANAFLFLQYEMNSPTRRIARKRANEDSAFAQRQAAQARALQEERAEMEAHAKLVSEREELVRQAQALADRELQLAQQAARLQSVRDRTRATGTQASASSVPAMPPLAQGNGNEPHPLPR